MTMLIDGIPKSFVEKYTGDMFTLTPVESLLRFVITHDIEFVPNQHNLNYTAIVKPKAKRD